MLPVYTQGTTAISIDRDIGIGQIMDVGFTDRNFAVAVYDSLFEAGWMGTPGQSVKEVLGSFTGMNKSRRNMQGSNIYSICTDGYVYSIV